MKTKLISKLTIVALVLSAILVTAASCGRNQEANKTSDNTVKEKTVIRVGYFPNITHTQALVGVSDGTFKKALGNDVQIEERNFNAGPAEIEALLAGEIDLGYIGPVPAINGYVKSKGGLRVVAGAVDAGAVLVAGKDSNIKSVKDLAITENIKKDQLASQKTINDQIKKLTGKSLPDDVLKSSFQRITVTYNPETESIKEFVKLSVDNGYIKETPDVSNLVDLTILNRVLQKKGLPAVR